MRTSLRKKLFKAVIFSGMLMNAGMIALLLYVYMM